jgi:hypothetical protein
MSVPPQRYTIEEIKQAFFKTLQEQHREVDWSVLFKWQDFLKNIRKDPLSL